MNTREIGEAMESQAVEYLASHGMRIVERNFRSRQGEIDIIGYHAGYLVFVEVKYRKNMRRGSAHDAVGSVKQRKICRTADFYRYIHHLDDTTSVRYDVIAIQGEKFEWIQNAFSHIYL